MSAVKFNLVPNPTFTKSVGIPMHGDGGIFEDIIFTFKHKSESEILSFQESIQSSTDVLRKDYDIVMEIACGWDLEDEFNADNVKLLCENYLGAGKEIYQAYMFSILQEKEKN